MTRDEIIEAIKDELFSVRYEFFKRLDEASWVHFEGDRGLVKLAWPDALVLIPVAKWNEAYIDAMHFKEQRRKRSSGHVNE